MERDERGWKDGKGRVEGVRRRLPVGQMKTLTSSVPVQRVLKESAG